MTTVYLIRHSVKYPGDGFDIYNSKDDKDIRDEKTMLSVTGEKRAEILCSKEEFNNIDVVFASNMVRSMQTAKYLCYNQNKQLNIDERLNERRYGKDNSEEFPDWFTRQYLDKNFKTIGGESQEDVRNRMYEFLNEILNKYQNKRIAVFSHGYAITFLLLKWCDLVNINEDRIITIKYKEKIIMNKPINAPEVFKLEFENNELLDIDLIEFDDLPFAKAGI